MGIVNTTKSPDQLTKEMPYYVRALAMALPAVMLGLQISGWIFFLPGAMQGHCDFRHLYAAGYMARTGHRGELYDYGVEQNFQNELVSRETVALPFNHLAYESLFFLCYSFLSYRWAYFFFLATNIFLLWVAIHLMSPWGGNLRSIFVWLPAALFFTFLPVAAAFMQGQDSIILLSLLSGAYVLFSSGRAFSAGLLVGLGLFKFQIVIPLALLFLLWRRGRFVGGFAVSAIAVLAISVLLVGADQMNVYAHSLLSMSVRETGVDQVKFNINPLMMPNLRGLVTAVCGSLVTFGWIQTQTGVASLGALFWIAKQGMRQDPTRQFVLAVSASALLSYHLIVHDLSILLIPLVVSLNTCAASGDLDSRTGVVSTVMFSAPAIIALTSARPYVIGISLLAFVAVLGVRTRRLSEECV